MPFNANGIWEEKRDRSDFDFVGRFREGYDNRMLRGATQDARDAYAAGDPDKAASLIMPYDSQAAAGYRDEGTRAYQRRYADAYGSGDFDKAMTEARGRGDLQGLTAARTGQNNSRFAGMVQEANKYRADLRRINQLQDPKQKTGAYDAFLAQMAERAKAAGNDPRFLSELKETFPEWNEQAFTALDTMLLQAARAYGSDDPQSYIANWVKEQEILATRGKAEREERRLDIDTFRADETARHNLASENNTIAAINARGGGGNGVIKLQPEARTAIENVRASLPNARIMRQEATRWLKLNRERGTGGYGERTPGLNISWFDDDARKEMRGITARVTPLMRQPGSGTMSDKDVELFQRGTLSIENPGNVNGTIAKAMIEAAENAEGYLDFLEEYAQNNRGQALGAERLWTQYLNTYPIFSPDGSSVNTNRPSWRVAFGLEGAQAPQPSDAAPAAPARRRVDINGREIR